MQQQLISGLPAYGDSGTISATVYDGGTTVSLYHFKYVLVKFVGNFVINQIFKNSI